MPCYLEYMVLMWSTVDRSYMEEPGSKASVRSRDGIQGNVLLYIGFYNNAGILLCVCMTLISGHELLVAPASQCAWKDGEYNVKLEQ